MKNQSRPSHGIIIILFSFYKETIKRLFPFQKKFLSSERYFKWKKRQQATRATKYTKYIEDEETNFNRDTTTTPRWHFLEELLGRACSIVSHDK